VIEQLAQRDSDWRLMAFKITKDKDLADDIVQEMYLKSVDFKNVRKIDWYVYFVLRNLFYDSLKTKEILIDDFTKFEIIEDENDNNIGIDFFKTKEELEELLQTVSWLERTVVYRSHIEGQRKLARNSGIHIQTIHNINKKAKEKLICQIKNQNLEQ
jgi:DNA-directed RNA polymerase specialized sigma24 family protein